MLLEGSCHCGSVRFRVQSETFYPYQACYCSICRKTAGGGGYAVNLGAEAGTLEVEGRDNVSVYTASSRDRGSPERNFCGHCGSFLWLFNPMWPDLVHPYASAIDTPLPKPPECVRIMLNYAAPWCDIPANDRETHFPEYPEESLEDWHRRHGLL
ncbi:GFA family protein [Rubrobacter tropicus]|uniref:GFA family protein n=1 Tax=Rubrobacter tropicus TaxID=2653851 RepID=A0A6G8QF87_9ACTN|nr:GFA family protein [Rubrobacter tropicus]QIN84907.1 GFA family protein [Rubrobacter tropicus]